MEPLGVPSSERLRGMPPASLAFWMSSGVALFVLLGSLALVWAFEQRIEREERRAFEELARVNASFLMRSRLPQSRQMAAQLSEIIGARVFFWHPETGEVIGKNGEPPSPTEFGMPFDGKARFIASGRWLVGLKGRDGWKVMFLKPVSTRAHAMGHRDTWLALGFFWLLSLALGWSLARRVTGPLLGLAKSLPLVGTERDLPELPVTRRDEIGQLARTLTRTHQTLRDERELRRTAERHALLGRMAASLAHEIRNPVSAIRLHAQLLEHATPAEASVSRGLIESEAARIEELVSQWLNHARPVPPVLADVDLAELLQHVVGVMEPQARHSGARIEVVHETTPPWMVRADRHRLQQTFTNVLRNAVQAMPSGGGITVRVADAGNRVAVVVEDSGPGFSPSALARAGEPFYSEKEGGMGLGLAVAKDICLAHGGRLVFENRTGGGAVVRMEFPQKPAMPGGSNPVSSPTP